MSHRKLLLIGSCCLLAIGWGRGRAGAQEPPPTLQKSEIVRLLIQGTWTEAEVVATIRRRCLGFRPTERDTEDFRSLGAGDEVIRAIQECGERVAPPSPDGAARRDGAPGATPRRPPPRRRPRVLPAEAVREAALSLSPRRIVAIPDTRTDVAVAVTSGDTPVRGLYLVLREDEEVRAAATSDERGRAGFRVASSPVPGEVRRYVVTASTPLVGDTIIEVETTAPEDVPDPSEAATMEAATMEAARRDLAGPEEDPGLERSPESQEAPERAAKRIPTDGEAVSMTRTFDDLREATLDLRIAQARAEALRGDFRRADGYLAEVEAIDPGRRDVRILRAYLALWGGDVQEGLRLFRELVREDPDDAEGWRGLGLALSRSGHEEEAREAYRRARRVLPR